MSAEEIENVVFRLCTPIIIFLRSLMAVFFEYQCCCIHQHRVHVLFCVTYGRTWCFCFACIISILNLISEIVHHKVFWKIAQYIVQAFVSKLQSVEVDTGPVRGLKLLGIGIRAIGVKILRHIVKVCIN